MVLVEFPQALVVHAQLKPYLPLVVSEAVPLVLIVVHAQRLAKLTLLIAPLLEHVVFAHQIKDVVIKTEPKDGFRRMLLARSFTFGG